MISFKTIAVASVLTFAAAPALAAGTTPCDITTLPCWGSGSKCNIHFKNHTGLATGDSGGTYNQVSSAATIRIVAKTKDYTQIGNALKILAGQSATMNLDSKVERAPKFSFISIKYDGYLTEYLAIPCDDIKRILSGNGTCHIWITTSQDYRVAYSCDGKTIIGRGYIGDHQDAK
jgi:hypothetical protein